MELLAKWFAEDTPTNAKNASATIGEGDDGKVTITYDNVGTEGNDYDIKIEIADTASAAMGVKLSNKTIVITLGTNGGGSADATKNTAKLIAEEINELAGFTATHSGEGTDSISSATTNNIPLTGGCYATPFYGDEAWLYIGSTYYYCSKPCSKYNTDAWKSVAFTII